MEKNKNKNKKFQKTFRFQIISFVIIFIFDFFLFPVPTILADNINAVEFTSDELIEQELVVVEKAEFINNLPENDTWKAVRSGYYDMTAYNSEVAQTNDQPCITANGFDLCEHWTEDTVAANFLKFGTRIRIPDLFGDRVFVVRDRMNKRYQHRVDIWMKEKQDALNFGIKYARIEILE
jgi:3D (Asp-Asp-Asp) domain-containing protein